MVGGGVGGNDAIFSLQAPSYWVTPAAMWLSWAPLGACTLLLDCLEEISLFEIGPRGGVLSHHTCDTDGVRYLTTRVVLGVLHYQTCCTGYVKFFLCATLLCREAPR